MTHPDTLQISRAVVEQVLEDLEAIDAYVDSREALRAALQPRAESELEQMRQRKDAAYLERNQVVAALAKCFPSGVSKTAIEGWSEDWHGCVYIDLPTGQVSWHFHDSQAYLFEGLPTYSGKWDGHDTDEKYRRVAVLQPQAAAEPGEPDGVVMGFTEDGCTLVEFACEGPHYTPQEGMGVYLSPDARTAFKKAAAEPVAYMDADGNFSDNNDYGTFNIPLYTTPPATQAGPVIPAGFALVPIRATAAMVEAFSEEGWEWANVLAAAEAVTEGEYEAALEGTPPATQAALTAASDCRTCQHLSEAWGVCEARPKCVGGEQYVYFPEKQLWDKTPRNDGQAAHQEMREALYAEFNSAVGRQHD